MNARSSKCLVAVMLIVLLALAVAPSAAQEGPPQVGLRPDAPPYALHGPYWAGVMELDAETPTHPTKIMVWYPALNPEGAEEATTYYYDYSPAMGNLPITYAALPDAAPDLSGGPYPLVIYVHGSYGQRHGGNWLGDHLATHGFVVVSIDQRDSQGSQSDATVFPGAWIIRPQEVSWQIDYAESLTASGANLENMIDTELIAVSGHSFGGYTALVTAGAQINPPAFKAWCEEYGAEFDPAGGCSLFLDHQLELAELAGFDSVPAGLWPPISDPRVDAVIGMAADPSGRFFGADGLGTLTVPTLLLHGSGDIQSNYDQNTLPAYAYLSSAQKGLVTFESADHNIFWFDCDAAPWYVPDFYYWCSDFVWDMDRAHDLTNHFVTAFLLATLKGDTEAAAALTPDAVQFPGITYETTGFPRSVASACGSAHCCLGSQ